jgi:hypothetical protein
MVREAHKRKGSAAGKIGGLLLVNILPLGGLLWFGWALATGRVSSEDLPEGLGRNAILAGVALALLFVSASLVLPFVHGIAKGLRLAGLHSAERRREGGAGRLVFEWILWPFRTLLYLVFWLLRAALYLTSLALIAAIILFAIRLFQPEFGEAWLPINDYLDRGETWIRGLSRG